MPTCILGQRGIPVVKVHNDISAVLVWLNGTTIGKLIIHTPTQQLLGHAVCYYKIVSPNSHRAFCFQHPGPKSALVYTLCNLIGYKPSLLPFYSPITYCKGTWHLWHKKIQDRSDPAIYSCCHVTFLELHLFIQLMICPVQISTLKCVLMVLHSPARLAICISEK